MNKHYMQCNNCKGTGKVFDKALGIGGLGFGFIAQIVIPEFKIDCSKCNGTGRKEIK